MTSIQEAISVANQYFENVPQFSLTQRSVSRRAILLGGLGVSALPLLAACSGAAATPTAAPAATTAPAPTTAAAKPTTAPATAPTTAPTTAATAAPTTAPAAAATAAPTVAPTAQAAASIAKVGGKVSVIASWGGNEQDSFMAMVKPWEDQSGATVEYTGTRDLQAVLATRVKGGNPPDLAGLPSPGVMDQYASQGKLVDLTSVVDMATMKQQYSSDWLTLGQAAGKQVGIFIKADIKGLIWYDVQNFSKAGYQIPKSWADLMTLSQKIAGTGTTPWSIGLESGAASGWPAADWLQDIVLRQAGPEVYDAWYKGTQKWASPEIKQAWTTWGDIVANAKMVYGGKQYMLATNFGSAADPVFDTPPKAYLHHQSSFITTNIEKDFPKLKPVIDFNFFPFPDITTQYTGAVQGSGDLFGMFNSTPQSTSLIKWLTTPEAQSIWVKRGGAISPNKLVSPDAYPDQISKESAQTLTGAKIVRFSADDLMPSSMENAMWKATLSYVGDPTSLDSILAHLDTVRGTAYKQ